MMAWCLGDSERVWGCQSWGKHTHLKRIKLINCYKPPGVINTNKIFQNKSINLLHLAKHVLLQGCDQIALLFPNTWHMQAINKQVQDVHWYHRHHLLTLLSFTHCSPFLILSWLSPPLQPSLANSIRWMQQHLSFIHPISFPSPDFLCSSTACNVKSGPTSLQKMETLVLSYQLFLENIKHMFRHFNYYYLSHKVQVGRVQQETISF